MSVAAAPTSVWLRSKTGPLVGRALGYYLDAENHVVFPQCDIETPAHRWSRMWAHSGKGSTCRCARWDVEAVDHGPPQVINGRKVKGTPNELTLCDADIIAFEPVGPIAYHRNAWSAGRPHQSGTVPGSVRQ